VTRAAGLSTSATRTIGFTRPGLCDIVLLVSPGVAARFTVSSCVQRGDFSEGMHMGKKRAEGVYKIVDVVGVSETSWEEAGRNAVETAAESLRDLRVAEVTKMDMKVEDGKVAAFRTRVSLSFKYKA
jgi:flavin-binding protein dodecin